MSELIRDRNWLGKTRQTNTWKQAARREKGRPSKTWLDRKWLYPKTNLWSSTKCSSVQQPVEQKSHRNGMREEQEDKQAKTCSSDLSAELGPRQARLTADTIQPVGRQKQIPRSHFCTSRCAKKFNINMRNDSKSDSMHGIQSIRGTFYQQKRQAWTCQLSGREGLKVQLRIKST